MPINKINNYNQNLKFNRNPSFFGNIKNNNENILNLINNIKFLDKGKYNHLFNDFINYIENKNLKDIFDGYKNYNSSFYNFINKKIINIKKKEKIIILDWENFRNYVKNNLITETIIDEFYHPPTDTIGETKKLNSINSKDKTPLSIPNIVSLIFINELINIYKIDKVFIVYKSALYKEPINFFFSHFTNNSKYTRDKFIFFKFYIHNIQLSYDENKINSHEYDIIRGIDDYGCIILYDYLLKNNYFNTSIITNDKRSVLDMLNFNKLLNTNRGKYIFRSNFENGLMSDLQMSYVIGNINMRTNKTNISILKEEYFKYENIMNIIIRTTINYNKESVSNLINNKIIFNVNNTLKKFYEFSLLNSQKENVIFKNGVYFYIKQLFYCYNQWYYNNKNKWTIKKNIPKVLKKYSNYKDKNKNKINLKINSRWIRD